MKVAVVGATGVLGRSLVPMLNVQHEVRALARSLETTRRLFGTEVEAVECDLLAAGTAERLPAMLAGCDAVIHAATAIPPLAKMSQTGAWDMDRRLRTEGTAHLLAAALQVGIRVYIQQSIALAYPDGGDEWITEDAPIVNNPAVIEMERLVSAVPKERLRWSILRGGAFVGTGTFQDDAIAGLRAGTQKLACEGSAYLTLIHVEDVAAAFVAALEHAPSGSTYNVVDEPIRQRDYLNRLAEAVGAPKPQNDPSLPCRAAQRVSNRAIREALGWTPTHEIIPNGDFR